jgi:V8-like Glu-specific endopeptidase
MQRQVTLLLTGVLGLCLATSALAGPHTAQRTAAEKAAFEAQILALQGHKGAAADAARRALPVPVYAVDLDDQLRAHETEATGAGVPRIVADNAARPTGKRLAQRPPDPDLLGGRAPAPAADDTAGLSARTVFDTDDRVLFEDHTYPYRTVGRVSNSQGSCSGTLVGPQHLLTASHCVVWNADGTIGWLKFEASRYDAFTLGVAWATRLHYYRQVDGSTLSDDEIAFDFVVVVLDTRLGDELGWMGSKAYKQRWNGGAYWANIGYPTDLGGTTRPVFQQGCAITDTARQQFGGHTSLQLFSRCDIIPGQSGSALYGFWDEVPHVVAVTSAENPVTNFFAGGKLLPTLIKQARTEVP